MTAKYRGTVHRQFCDVCGSELEFHGGNQHRYHCTNAKCPVQYIVNPQGRPGRADKKQIVYTTMEARRMKPI